MNKAELFIVRIEMKTETLFGAIAVGSFPENSSSTEGMNSFYKQRWQNTKLKTLCDQVNT